MSPNDPSGDEGMALYVIVCDGVPVLRKPNYTHAVFGTHMEAEPWCQSRETIVRYVPEESARASRWAIVLDALLAREKSMAACMIGCSWDRRDNGGTRHLAECELVTQGFVDRNGNRLPDSEGR